MSDLLRVVERSQDHAMDIEDYLAREQLGEAADGPDRAAPRRRRRVSFAAELRAAAADVWEAQHAHPFVRGIGDGTLDEARFRYYVRQDYRFLIDYGRLLALGAARAPRRRGDAPLRRARPVGAGDRDGAARRVRRALGDRRRASSRPSRRRRRRRRTPTSCCAPRRSATTPSWSRRCCRACGATRRSASGWRRPACRTTRATRRGSPTYADPEFQALAAWARELTDAAGADAGPGARERMHAAFRASSEHELAFWEAAWRYDGRVSSVGAMTELRTVRVAAVQATPVVLDAEATVAKACRLLGRGGRRGRRAGRAAGDVRRALPVQRVGGQRGRVQRARRAVGAAVGERGRRARARTSTRSPPPARSTASTARSASTSASPSGRARSTTRCS